MDYQTKKLSEITKVFADGDWIESKDQSPKGIRLIQTGNVGIGSFKDRGDKSRYISEETFDRLNCTEIFPNDCLVSRLPEPVGRSCLIPELPDRLITAVDCTIMRFKDFVVPKYFVYYSQCNQYQRDVDIKCTGATRKRISRKALGDIEIPLPPLETQKAIVAKLDQIFAELDQTKSEIQKNLDNTDELWKSAYDLKIEELKEKYGLKKLEEICSLITDGSHFSPKTTTEGLPYITVKDIDDEGNIDTENSKKISEEDFAVLVQNGCQPKKGDVLYSKDGTIGKIHLVDDENFVVLSSLAIIRPGKDVKSEYLYQIFHSNFFEKQAVGNKTGAAIKRIVLKTIKSLEIPVPPLSEQEKIVEHLDQVSKEVKALKSQYQSQLDNLEELKKSVLDKAFKGELME